jgi:hypothetical protein
MGIPLEEEGAAFRCNPVAAGGRNPLDRGKKLDDKREA